MNMHFLCILNAPNRFIIIQETQYPKKNSKIQNNVHNNFTF